MPLIETANIPVLTLAAVFALIAVRRAGRARVKIWQAMAGGAAVVLAAGSIEIRDALRAIDPDVMMFLSGVFVTGRALVASGYLYCLADRVFGATRSGSGLLFAVIFGAGFSSALLMNDTLAIIGTPLMLHFAREYRMDAKLMLLALAFAVTIGSVMSPIGNPQNLLIAARGGVENPFVTFLEWLAVPTVINLFITYIWLRWLFRASFHDAPLTHTSPALADPALARLARAALLIMLALIAVKIAGAVWPLPFELRLSHIALAGAAPVLLFSSRRVEILRRIDWATLVFFAAMFVLMASVWRSGFFQAALARWEGDVTSLYAVLGAGVGVSQLISNVPLVALYLPVLQEAGAGVPALMALAAGSTIAGNLFILGAASNVIIIQNAERQGVTLTFFEFARAGVPLTVVNALVYGFYLKWFGGF